MFSIVCIVSSNSAYGEVYSIQHYVIKFVSDLQQVSGFLWVLRFPLPIKLTSMTYVLLKVMLNTITITLTYCMYYELSVKEIKEYFILVMVTIIRDQTRELLIMSSCGTSRMSVDHSFKIAVLRNQSINQSINLTPLDDDFLRYQKMVFCNSTKMEI